MHDNDREWRGIWIPKEVWLDERLSALEKIILFEIDSLDNQIAKADGDKASTRVAAGVPGRHELHKGETNYPFVIKAADDAGYDRYFGFEYWPTYDNKKSLTDILNYVRG